ncbi:hypothetical protein D5S17_01445 [Pseudonocardiaceae bacterium YIM PH 21723]|nr:hypothetical protein D5S17_01445 [Pseudonocardiaceae bacterium YIM PH 21723]
MLGNRIMSVALLSAALSSGALLGGVAAADPSSPPPPPGPSSAPPSTSKSAADWSDVCDALNQAGIPCQGGGKPSTSRPPTAPPGGALPPSSSSGSSVTPSVTPTPERRQLLSDEGTSNSPVESSKALAAPHDQDTPGPGSFETGTRRYQAISPTSDEDKLVWLAVPLGTLIGLALALFLAQRARLIRITGFGMAGLSRPTMRFRQQPPAPWMPGEGYDWFKGDDRA